MTREQFISQRGAFRRRSTQIDMIFVVILFGGFCAAGFLVFSTDKLDNGLFSVLFLIGFVGFLFGPVFLQGWLVRKRLREFGLSCGSCDCIIPVTQLDLAVASGRCANCGSVLFEATQ